MSAKTVVTILTGLSWLAIPDGFAGDQPRGKLIELNSCEVFAGGCMVSSEATLNGRYRVQAWDIAGGGWDGVDLSGLQVVVLEAGNANLAAARSGAERAVIYLPEQASAAQQRAVLSWLKSENGQLAEASIQTRVAPVKLRDFADGIEVEAGNFVRFRTVSIGDCAGRVCGEDLWYEPSTASSLFTVAINAASYVKEPLLKLTWSEHGKRSIFVARFGEARPTKNLFVRASDWCGPGGRLF
jgi:hypothetical protein